MSRAGAGRPQRDRDDGVPEGIELVRAEPAAVPASALSTHSGPSWSVRRSFDASSTGSACPFPLSGRPGLSAGPEPRTHRLSRPSCRRHQP